MRTPSYSVIYMAGLHQVVEFWPAHGGMEEETAVVFTGLDNRQACVVAGALNDWAEARLQEGDVEVAIAGLIKETGGRV